MVSNLHFSEFFFVFNKIGWHFGMIPPPPSIFLMELMPSSVKKKRRKDETQTLSCIWPKVLPKPEAATNVFIFFFAEQQAKDLEYQEKVHTNMQLAEERTAKKRQKR